MIDKAPQTFLDQSLTEPMVLVQSSANDSEPVENDEKERQYRQYSQIGHRYGGLVHKYGQLGHKYSNGHLDHKYGDKYGQHKYGQPEYKHGDEYGQLGHKCGQPQSTLQMTNDQVIEKTTEKKSISLLTIVAIVYMVIVIVCLGLQQEVIVPECFCGSVGLIIGTIGCVFCMFSMIVSCLAMNSPDITDQDGLIPPIIMYLVSVFTWAVLAIMIHKAMVIFLIFGVAFTSLAFHSDTPEMNGNFPDQENATQKTIGFSCDTAHINGKVRQSDNGNAIHKTISFGRAQMNGNFPQSDNENAIQKTINLSFDGNVPQTDKQNATQKSISFSFDTAHINGKVRQSDNGNAIQKTIGFSFDTAHMNGNVPQADNENAIQKTGFSFDGAYGNLSLDDDRNATQNIVSNRN